MAAKRMKKDPRKEWFTVPEAAEVLGVSYQAIYDAVRKGKLRAAGRGWERRIHVEDLIAYGVRTGKNPSQILERVREEKKASWDEILVWVLAALGIAWLLARVLSKRE